MLPRVALALPLAFTPAPPAAPGDAGYWLSTELVGPASARARALEQLRATLDEQRGHAANEPVDEAPSPTPEGSPPSWTSTLEPASRPGLDLPPVPAGLTGEAVAHVPDIQTALRWVERTAFGAPASEADAIDPPQLRTEPAAIPGGSLHGDLGVQLRSLAVSGQTPVGERRPVDWPADPATILPSDSAWQIAELLPRAAPIFAAPAPAIPPASERFATIRGGGDLFVVRTLDRCEGDGEGRRCLRWAQVVARDEDRFVPGFLPAFQVAAADGWARGEGTLPRAILLRSGVEGARARFLLVARARDESLHRTTVTAELDADAFPDASVRVEGDLASVGIGHAPARSFPLDATLDGYGDSSPPAADAGDPRAADVPAPARSGAR